MKGSFKLELLDAKFQERENKLRDQEKQTVQEVSGFVTPRVTHPIGDGYRFFPQSPKPAPTLTAETADITPDHINFCSIL